MEKKLCECGISWIPENQDKCFRCWKEEQKEENRKKYDEHEPLNPDPKPLEDEEATWPEDFG